MNVLPMRIRDQFFRARVRRIGGCWQMVGYGPDGSQWAASHFAKWDLAIRAALVWIRREI